MGSESNKVIPKLEAEKAEREKMEKLFEQKNPIVASMQEMEREETPFMPLEDIVEDVVEEVVEEVSEEPTGELDRSPTKVFEPYSSEHAKPEKVTMTDGTKESVTQLQSKPQRTQTRSYNVEGLLSGNSVKGKKGDFSLEIEKSPTKQRGELSLGKYDFEEEKVVLEDEAIKEAFEPEKTEVSLKENL